jgi:hypothetical protein
MAWRLREERAVMFIVRALVVLAGLAVGCEAPVAMPEHGRAVAWSAASATVRIEPRGPSIPTYPCAQCHAPDKRAPDPRERRITELHTRIQLEHGSTARWCYSCHVAEEMNLLALPDGKRVPFDASHELCGACHGEVMADWRQGIHGLQSGYWNGDKSRRSCTHCHDPHRPRSSVAGWSYPPMHPLPPPAREAHR